MTLQQAPARARRRIKQSGKDRRARYRMAHSLAVKPASTGVRWSKGERLEDLFEGLCDTLAFTGEDTSPAVIAEGTEYSFRDLDNRANQAARHLQKTGIKAGDRVALLLDKSFDTYVVLLAVQKLHAAYVPLDKSFPNERIAFILEDADVRAIVSQNAFRENSPPCPTPRCSSTMTLRT